MSAIYVSLTYYACNPMKSMNTGSPPMIPKFVDALIMTVKFEAREKRQELHRKHLQLSSKSTLALRDEWGVISECLGPVRFAAFRTFCLDAGSWPQIAVGG